MSINRYIHIGFPKALSTALQRNFFDAHPNIYHLGVGCGGNLDYIDPDVELAVEDYLLFCKDLRYREKQVFIANIFQRFFSAAESDPHSNAVGISNESLSFGYIPGHIDVTVKARRLLSIFGGKTSIIMIIRNQPALLRSLYRESIRNGYWGSFNDFMKYVYFFQDRGFLYDFLYDRQYELYSSLFGSKNVHVFQLEEFLTSGRLKVNEEGKIELFNRLCGILNVPYVSLPLERYNDPLSPKELSIKERLNRERNHDLGHSLLTGVVNIHRLRRYFERDLHWPAEEWIYDDVKCKRELISRAKKLASK
ncbi:MAG: hypothetical protein P8X90_11715, partial [Desulfobacterales bacterium]